MASSTSSAHFFFKAPLAERLNERKDSTGSSVSNKSWSLENPLLGRDPPVLITETYPPDSVTAPTFGFSSSGEEGLRHRQRVAAVTFREEKENLSSLTANNGKNRGLPPRSNFGGVPADFPPPPRASASLGTGMERTMALSSYSTSVIPEHKNAAPQVEASPTNTKGLSHRNSKELSLVPSTNNCWVLVFGYATVEHYDELLRLFSSFGHVLDHRGVCQPGQSNWIAIQYSNELEAKKALCHTTVQLSSNIFCGVKPLAHDDPILLYKRNAAGTGIFGESQLLAVSKDRATNPISSGLATPGITENDILLRASGVSAPRKDFCTRFLRWILGIPADLE